jgi:hypothetical protein
VGGFSRLSAGIDTKKAGKEVLGYDPGAIPPQARDFCDVVSGKAVAINGKRFVNGGALS